MSTERTVNLRLTGEEALDLYKRLSPEGKSQMLDSLPTGVACNAFNQEQFRTVLEAADVIVYEPDLYGLHKIEGICIHKHKGTNHDNDALPPTPDEAKAGEYTIITADKRVYAIYLNLDTSDKVSPRQGYPDLMDKVTVYAETIKKVTDNGRWEVVYTGYSESCVIETK